MAGISAREGEANETASPEILGLYGLFGNKRKRSQRVLRFFRRTLCYF